MYLIHLPEETLPYRVVKYGKIIAYCRYHDQAADYLEGRGSRAV